MTQNSTQIPETVTVSYIDLTEDYYNEVVDFRGSYYKLLTDSYQAEDCMRSEKVETEENPHFRFVFILIMLYVIYICGTD